jgi:poly(A) polymerase
LLVRYTRNDSGKTVQQALIYTAEEHKIQLSDIDPEALKITRRLRASGHHAYIVGGAVRDLMLGKHPKDFDIATDAQPNRIRRLFRNSRVIGKRFRLVHIFFGDNIIEVSTFRSEASENFQNEYGEIEEDVMRRDFTVNALYYDPVAGRVVDYVGGVEDVRGRRLKPVIPLERIFVEDPVRMIRAMKYSVGGNLKMAGKLKRLIKRQADLLAEISPSRMTEEVYKILLSGRSSAIFRECMDFGLFPHMIPTVNKLTESDSAFRAAVLSRLADLDKEVVEGNESRRSRAIAYLAADFLYTKSSTGAAQHIAFNEAFADVKKFIQPLVPANKDVEMGLIYLVRRRKNYLKSGSLETTPPSQRPYNPETDREKASTGGGQPVDGKTAGRRTVDGKSGGRRRGRSGARRTGAARAESSRPRPSED